MTPRDPIVADLAIVHENLVTAGKVHTAGDPGAAADLLEIIRVDVIDLIADLRRLADRQATC